MKRKIIIILSSVLTVAAITASCARTNSPSSQPSENSTASDTQSTQDRISELEAKILTLIQNQQLSDTERKKEIDALNAELERLKSTAHAKPTESERNESNSESESEESESDTTPANTFKYMLDGNRAIITEITTVSDNVKIPSAIDGYQVYSIGSEALSSKTVKSVVISEGIEKLDWFAFRNCISLSSITVPSSVVSIGYGAFDNVSKSLTIKCQKDSFAHRYAQSYGLTYDIT